MESWEKCTLSQEGACLPVPLWCGLPYIFRGLYRSNTLILNCTWKQTGNLWQSLGGLCWPPQVSGNNLAAMFSRPAEKATPCIMCCHNKVWMFQIISFWELGPVGMLAEVGESHFTPHMCSILPYANLGHYICSCLIWYLRAVQNQVPLLWFNKPSPYSIIWNFLPEPVN